MENFKPFKRLPQTEKPLREVKPVERDPTIPASGDYWITLMQDIAQGEVFDPEHNPEDAARVERMLAALTNDVPSLCSCVMERACNLACTHCLYPWREKSAKAIAEANNLGDAVENIVRQLPEAEGTPQFLHSGKILQEWHLSILKRLRAARENLQIGIIDNGTYVRHLNSGAFGDFRFDWIDISLDGTEESHNAQREPGHKEATGREPTAYKETIEGLERAREVTKSTLEGGKVNSLMTVTALNYKDIEAVADTLFAENPRAPGMPMADQMNITLMTPLREPNAYIELAKEWRTGNLDEMREVWEQICRVHTKYNTPDNQRVFFTLYRPLDIEKLAQAIGPKKNHRCPY